MLPIKIALTGGIACGKSNVARSFAELGVDIIDLDELSRLVVEPGTAGLSELIDYFSDQILNVDKTLNRHALREILLKNSVNQEKIESILHPKILEKMKMEIKKVKNKLIIIEIPLLVEKNLTYLFDRAIIVECNEENQLKRLLNRENIDKNTAKQLISSQTSHKKRLELTDQFPIDVIENNSEIFKMEQKVTDLYQKLINL
ncbi:Dephospho-CoA kinase (EC 2.7.1.24) [uncultured Gammaproteobacteria bacterium]|uniref:dephospho-CoA kinase n=1 Tax=Bathymodiolus heckerae thiotrophic gill symbiont TaxID=1052212 RepID=UPI0010B7BABD|nr:dephospho-CoA kinase [Bathymodiolus heckerae thiotrophic gill symbiont]CAC9527573.1 Dephospho-CoA kinase (EC 2.7.1.24) [uncultured Gammaproteobacteria bacterium]CAC9595324.1 Dephospho-CoA kinase (EC 2.7.1.24) [uncultured Gammaproteobacteria bacterium]CAC9950436.1 Dephospho-CoA kinase (EC 2.7.1.24) [uncultured Gammaproteobacteria bacterium]CAC9959053.1 Dephospho-CoA kinase (EC 2.7.1.24) [uncultured Gammaproteobacteria bacterium]SHN92506.1 Dephospho-CoA kinase [Bathymodiolus heckerae thiotrop